ncbi:MAG: hypothetical protein EB078_10315 [Proteobacteria bacterium]|nr:hypothetical protein [Pseudomonadota bacterium]NDC23109.1 hypothetical protein [Pseudomonadota bacterium]NDD05289.1 hypothetical protein [Pseudomonadota bacterium]
MFFIVILFLSQQLFASLPPRPIPRTSSKIFVKTGVFEGGTAGAANLEGIRFSRNKTEETERWVLDFSSAHTRSLQETAPKFQVRYSQADRIEVPEGRDVLLNPPRLIISLQSIKGNYLTRAQFKPFLERSQLVRDIKIYPPIEDGDMAVEFILKHSIQFEPHQPIQKEGRLVLDLKPIKQR